MTMSKGRTSISKRLKNFLAPITTSKVEVVMFAFRLDVFAIRLVRADTSKFFLQLSGTLKFKSLLSLLRM